MNRYSLGIDYGTSSCRAIVVDLTDGSEVAEAVYHYQAGTGGVITIDSDPELARQDPADYLAGLEFTAREAIAKAVATVPGFVPAEIASVGFATTGSTPIPVDREGTALSLLPQFKDRLAAKAWLWKDHTSHEEAARITDTAWKMRPDYIRAYGGTYSSEWFWAKIWHCSVEDPEVFEAAYSWVELTDFLVGALTGTAAPDKLKRSATPAGHKAFYSEAWGGLPDEEFLNALDPKLAALRSRLYDKAYPTTDIAGYVTPDWAERTGLEVGTPVAVGHFDAHAAGVAGGAREGTFVKVMGTSTCDVTVIPARADGSIPDIPGMCGVVPDAIIPGQLSVEAGQSAVGDIFNWFSNEFLGGAGATDDLAIIGARAEQLRAGEHGLLALDWQNGNRSVLVDQRLTGLILGLTLHTEPHHVLRALVEATAFSARRIIETVEAGGSPITRVVAAGGLPSHAPWMIQVYADVIGREIIATASAQGSALGAALVAAVAAGEFESIEEAQDRLVHYRDHVFTPSADAAEVYNRIYAEFTAVHDAFAKTGVLGSVMKHMLDIRDAALKED